MPALAVIIIIISSSSSSMPTVMDVARISAAGAAAGRGDGIAPRLDRAAGASAIWHNHRRAAVDR